MSTNRINIEADNARAREGQTPMSAPTELERVAQNKLHEMLMIEYGFVTENVEPMKALLTTYAQTVAEEAVRAEKEQIIHELNDEYHMHMKGGEVQDFIREWQEALTPPTK